MCVLPPSLHIIFLSISILLSGDIPPASAAVARKLLSSDGGWLCASWAECIAFARRKFEKYFNHKARQLLSHFPEGK